MIRQLTMVRKFRNSINFGKTKNSAKKGKTGVSVGAQKKNLLNLQMKIQGGLGSLSEIEENINDDGDILIGKQKVKEFHKPYKSDTNTKIGGNLAGVKTVNNQPNSPFPTSPRIGWDK